MSLEGVDYSDGRPGGAALAAAGKSFAARYLAYRGNPDPHKALTTAEVNDLMPHGISIVANFESTSNRVLDGSIAGSADAADAKIAMNALGFPVTCPVYFSVDFDAQPVHQGRIDAYLTAAASILGRARVGVYGSLGLLTRCRQNGTATWYWQTIAWSGGKTPPTWVHLFQYQTGSTGAKPINGAAVDYDRALQGNYGQWQAPSVPGPSVEDAMIYTMGGCRTATVASGTTYSHEPGGPPAGQIKNPVRYLLTAFDATGKYVALDGLYAGSTTTVLTLCGWVPVTALLAIAPAIPDVAAVIAADRAKAHIVYGATNTPSVSTGGNS
jgi:Domain of unknown function (DUF1906)